MVGFVFASGRKGMEVMAPGLLRRTLRVGKGPKVATWHTKIRHLAYMLCPAPILQSDESSSRMPSESLPLPEQPGFSVASASIRGPSEPGLCPSRAKFPCWKFAADLGWWHYASSGEEPPAGLPRREKGEMRRCTRG